MSNKFRGLDANGDWMFGQGIGSYAQGSDALALDIAARLRMRKGNCFFAPTAGVDYTNLMEKGQENQLIAAMTNAILQTSGVVKILSFSHTVNPRTRDLSLEVTVQTIYTRSFTMTLNNLLGAPN